MTQFANLHLYTRPIRTLIHGQNLIALKILTNIVFQKQTFVRIAKINKSGAEVFLTMVETESIRKSKSIIQSYFIFTLKIGNSKLYSRFS